MSWCDRNSVPRNLYVVEKCEKSVKVRFERGPSGSMRRMVEWPDHAAVEWPMGALGTQVPGPPGAPPKLRDPPEKVLESPTASAKEKASAEWCLNAALPHSYSDQQIDEVR